MKRFWMRDEFVRKHARNLSTSDHSVYMGLSSHADRNGETFVGYRKLAEELGINKDTVMKSVKHLIAYGLVGRLENKASVLKLLTVRFQPIELSDQIGHKEYKKEFIKEKNFKKLIDWRSRGNNFTSLGDELIKKYGKFGINELAEEVRNGNFSNINNPKNGP